MDLPSSLLRTFQVLCFFSAAFLSALTAVRLNPTLWPLPPCPMLHCVLNETGAAPSRLCIRLLASPLSNTFNQSDAGARLDVASYLTSSQRRASSSRPTSTCVLCYFRKYQKASRSRHLGTPSPMCASFNATRILSLYSASLPPHSPLRLPTPHLRPRVRIHRLSLPLASASVMDTPDLQDRLPTVAFRRYINQLCRYSTSWLCPDAPMNRSRPFARPVV
ncbi:uncharacterized protein A4U43_C09F13360 [Asparagus officinalis]|uniref:Uncharacterized protein n=1 Tax=Asparagus officinalis TaxID=4686 RepID=A0A5P1E7C4_ASPOF|nr:uncharacterized protein A4U43_C09F13360 [Asparagus officinalis]